MEDEYQNDNRSFYENSFGAPKAFRGNAFVGFIDLLGFSNRLIEFWDDSTIDPVVELLKVINHVEPMGVSASITDPLRPAVTYNSYRTMLSDALIISVALPSSEASRVHDARAAFGCLALHIQDVVGACLRLGFATRGGIGYGGACWGSRIFTGPALVQAYRLESNVAKTARVVLGKEVELMEANRRHVEEEGRDDSTWRFLPPWYSLTYLGVDRHLSLIPASKRNLPDLQRIVDKMCQAHLAQPDYLSKYNELQLGLRYSANSNVTEAEVRAIADERSGT